MQNLLARGRNEVFPNNCVDVFPEAAISTNLLISAQLSVGTCQKTSLPLLQYDDDGGSKDIVSMVAYDEDDPGNGCGEVVGDDSVCWHCRCSSSQKRQVGELMTMMMMSK